MAYSDYGGYAYRNGKRVESRSDATIKPDGDTFGTPGMYPGFAQLAAGVSHKQVMAQMDWPSGHAILGDGPVYVVLRKQWATVYRGPERLDLPIDRQEYQDPVDERYEVEVDGYKIEVVLTYEDNFYVYTKVTQPDGNVWHGWSGYGVGAGLEDAGYGFSTCDREEKLVELWPGSIVE
jgi:hypothetical protein